MLDKNENNNLKQEFREDFYSEASKQSKTSSLNLDKQIEDIKNASIFKIPSSLNKNKFKYTQEALYCNLNIEYNQREIYLRIGREESKFTYCIGYFSEDVSEDNFKKLSPFYKNKKPITEEDNNRNKFLGKYSKGKFGIEEELSEVTIELINVNDYEVITHDFKVYEEIADRIESESSEENNIKYLEFSDYPIDIQEEAKKQIQEDKLFENILFSVSITHNGDDILKDLLLLVFGSVFVSEPVSTEVGGDTGTGKSDLVYYTSDNYPKRYIKKLRKFSSKFVYYAKDSFDKKFNILLFDDIDFSKEDNIETVKTFTDNREKVKKLDTVVKENNENKAKTFSLNGKFLGILTYAKSNPDEELSNRLFKSSIDDKKDKSEVKNTIKKNALTDIDNNELLQKINLINQCSIQYLIEEDFTVFNPFNILFNPKDFNNRDVSSFISLVNAKSFYHFKERRSISINDKKIVIGSLEDYKFVYDKWDNDIQKYKLSPNQEKILQLLPSFDSEDEFLDYAEAKQEEYSVIESSKAKELFRNELFTVNSLSKKLNVQVKTLKKDLDNSQEKGNKKHLLELGLIYRTQLNPNTYNSPYIYGKVNNMVFNSDNIMDIMDISKLYPLFNNLNVKISFLIYLINRYNILISYKKKKFIYSYCSNYQYEIKDYDSLCSFIESFIDNIGDWASQDVASIEDLKIHFKILRESEKFLKEYIIEKNISMSKTSESSSINKQDNKEWINQENIYNIHNETEKEEVSEEINDKIDIDTNLSELIQMNLEYYKELTKNELFEKLEINPNSDDHQILKIEKTLDGLVKSKILRIKEKGFKRFYVLRS